jgi:outer membrane protein TolC
MVQMRKRAHVLPMIVLGVLLASAIPSSGQVLSLESAIGIATDASTAVGRSREQLMVSRQQVLNSWGRFTPNLTMSSFAGHSYAGPGSARIDEQGRPVQPTAFDYEVYSFGISSQMLLFDWGANVKHLSSTERAAEASEYGLQYQKDVVTAQVIRAYYNLVRDQYLILVQEESVRAAQRNLDQVEAFFSIGSNTRADVLQAKVRLGNTQLALISAKNAEEISRATLASLLNYPINQSLEVDTSLTFTGAEVDLEKEIEYMLEHRSDLLGSRKLVSAAGDNVTSVQNQRWPTFSAAWNYSWSDRTFPDNANFFETQYSWWLGVSLNWNIFDRFQTKSSILNARAQERIAEYNHQQAKLDAVLEVKTIYLDLTEAQERMRVAQETTNQAAENLRLAEERYRVGAGTILETNDAQVQLTQARSDLVRAKSDYLSSRADLQRATGRPVKVQ